ncbi:MAG: insulinase family protein [Pseudomonadota bacterium]
MKLMSCALSAFAVLAAFAAPPAFATSDEGAGADPRAENSAADPQEGPRNTLEIVPSTPVPPVPVALQTGDETPWLYEGSDVPVDREWKFGKMDNGLRYAVRRNGVPPNQVSIRVRVDAGSLHERDEEQGFAHLLEHLLFRESQYLGQAEAIAAWQRLGATFGSDANAETSPTHTAYKLDIPDIDPAKLDESFKLLSGMIKAPVLSDENVAAELPIVLAEKRERGGAEGRVGDLTRRTFFAGQRLSERNPIGTVETLNAANGANVQAFYDRWYRPDKTVVVVAGDAPTDVLAGLVEKYFGDWKGTGPSVEAPDFGDPIAPAGAELAAGTSLPLGEMAVGVEADLPRNFTYAVMRPWRPVQDTIVYNEGLLLDALAQRIINRRLEVRARAGGSFLYAAVEQDDLSRSTDATFITFAPLTADWQTALADVRSVVADALTTPPTQEEIDREVAEFDVVFANDVETSRVQQGSDLADTLVNAVDIRETVASPETVLAVWRGMSQRFTPDEVFARTKALFEGDVVRSVYVTPEAGEANASALKVALASEAKVDSSARLAQSTFSFDELPAIGTPGTVTGQRPIGVLEVEQVNFDNGVRALLWSNDAEPGRVTVRVRFGAGYRAFDAESAVYASLGEMALIGSGIGELGQNEIDQIATGRKFGFDFEIDDGVFAFTALTRSEDVADQLYLFAAKLGMPRWDADPVIRAKAAAELAYNSYETSPAGVINRDLSFMVTDRDPRYATPDPEALKKVTPEGFRKVWEPILKQGPIEVMVFGEFDRDAVVAKLAETFGALPERTAISPQIANRVPGFPASNAAPTVLTHRGDANQAAAVISWPSGGGVTNLRESRQLEILTRLFSNRLLEAIREKAGASYAPQAFSDWPTDINGGGTITALAQIEPELVPLFFAEADRIAKDLATNPPTADELTRVTEPLAQQVRRASTGNGFWLYNLEGSTVDPRRIGMVRSLLVDYSQTRPDIMQFLASRYFGSREPLRLAVIPEGQELASAITAPSAAASDAGAAGEAELVTSAKQPAAVIGR